MSTLSLFPIFHSTNNKMSMSNRLVLDSKCEDVVVSSSPSIQSGSSSPSSRSVESVRRCLFGRSDSHENRRFAREELRKISVADQSRWNFDFVSDNPLPGRYDWEIVDNPTTSLPEPYKPVSNINLPATSSNKTFISRRALKISDISKANARRNLNFENKETSTTTTPNVIPTTESIEETLKTPENLTTATTTIAEPNISKTNNTNKEEISKSKEEDNNTTTTNTDNCDESRLNNLPQEDTEAIPPDTTITVISKQSKPSKQTTMTDFMKIRKRRCEESKQSEVAKKMRREEETV